MEHLAHLSGKRLAWPGLGERLENTVPNSWYLGSGPFEQVAAILI